MATGALVPVEVSPGRTIMVPDYLVPRTQAGLALPSAAPPPAAPDFRVAGPGGGPTDLGGAPDPSIFAAEDAATRQARDAAALREKLTAPTNEHAAAPGAGQPGWMPTGQGVGGPPPPAAANPNGLVRAGRPPTPGGAAPGPGGEMDPLVRRVFNEGGGGAPRGPGGMVPNTVKLERQPGKDLIPEYKWALGLEKRPDFGQEVDPNAEQPTWGTAEPVMRERKTGIERGAEAAGTSAVAQFQRDELARQELANAQHQQLLDQSSLIDEQLATLAARRERIAALQSTADQRMQEAASMEPRTREQVWGSKGNVGRGLAILAAVTGGLAGNNNGWNMVKQSVDDAAADEQKEAERRQQLGLAAKNDFERAIAIYGDTDMAMLDSKNRKLASMIAMTQQTLNDRGLDASAKDRALAVQAAAQQQFLANRQQMADLANGVALKEEVNYKQQAPTGGGGIDTLARLEHAARAQKALNTISGQDNKPKASPAELASVNDLEASLAPTEQLLSRYKSADQIPGIGGRNVVSRATRGVADFVAGEGSGSQALDTPEERANRQVVNDLRAGIKHAITGAGMSIKEADTLDELIVGARTKQDLENVIRTARTRIAAHRRLIAGGSSGTAEPAETPDSFQAEP